MPKRLKGAGAFGGASNGVMRVVGEILSFAGIDGLPVSWSEAGVAVVASNARAVEEVQRWLYRGGFLLLSGPTGWGKSLLAQTVCSLPLCSGGGSVLVQNEADLQRGERASRLVFDLDYRQGYSSRLGAAVLALLERRVRSSAPTLCVCSEGKCCSVLPRPSRWQRAEIKEPDLEDRGQVAQTIFRREGRLVSRETSRFVASLCGSTGHAIVGAVRALIASGKNFDFNPLLTFGLLLPALDGARKAELFDRVVDAAYRAGAGKIRCRDLDVACISVSSYVLTKEACAREEEIAAYFQLSQREVYEMTRKVARRVRTDRKLRQCVERITSLARRELVENAWKRT